MKKSITLCVILLFQFGMKNINAQPNTWNFVNYNGGAAFAEMMAGCTQFKIGNSVYILTGGAVNAPGNKFWKFTMSGGVGTWTTLANFPGTSRTAATAFSINGKGYFGFGTDGGSTYYNDFWEYDTITGWSVIPITIPWPSPRATALGFSIGSKGYVVAGYGGSHLNELWEYDPSSGWTGLTPPSPGGVYLSAGFCIGNKIYIGTGSSSTALDNSFREWNQATGIWTAKSPYPGVLRSGATGFSIGTKGYIGTGNDGTSSAYYADFYEYNQLTDSWTTVPTIAGLPSGQERFYATGFSLAGKGYVVGGGVTAGSAFNDLWQYTPLTPPAPEICLVSVDSLGLNNIVYWEKAASSTIDSFIIYRYDVFTPGYIRIGAVSNDSLSMFIDTSRYIGGSPPNNGDPEYNSWKYKLSIRDTFGIESPLSPFHQSIFVTQSLSVFNFGDYIIEGAPAISGYAFLRDDNNTGVWNILSGLTASPATDPAYASFPNGNWRIDALGFSCAPTRAGISTSRSNIKRANTSSINSSDDLINSFIIYPNPSNENITVEISGSIQNNDLKIFNALGEMVYETSFTGAANKNAKTINISSFSKGLYNVVIKADQKSLNRKLIVN